MSAAVALVVQAEGAVGILVNLRRVTPDRVWDLIMRAAYPTPKGSRQSE